MRAELWPVRLLRQGAEGGVPPARTDGGPRRKDTGYRGIAVALGALAWRLSDAAVRPGAGRRDDCATFSACGVHPGRICVTFVAGSKQDMP